jgi:hypothetical protein
LLHLISISLLWIHRGQQYVIAELIWTLHSFQTLPKQSGTDPAHTASMAILRAFGLYHKSDEQYLLQLISISLVWIHRGQKYYVA